MTTLRRTLHSHFKGESILSLAALVCAALLLAGQPALASSHGGGGGGGGHAGGGGGHASGGGGGHSSGGGSAHSSGGGGAHSSGGGDAHSSGGGGSQGAYGGGTAHPVGSGRFLGPGRVPGGRGGDSGHGDRGFHGDDDFHDRDFGFGGRFGFGGFGLGLGYGWDYPWGWGPGYYGYWGSGYPYAYGPGYYAPGYNDGYLGYNYDRGSTPRQSSREAMGALNLDISPSDAQVYLNGEYVGRVRDFGGWSRGYLWLEKGTYDIAFYKEGYRTLARQVSIYPGLVITWDDRLEHGQAVRPQDLPSKSHERHDSRLQYERDRSERIDRDQPMQRGGSYYQGNPPTPPAYEHDQDSGGWSDNWHDRVNHSRGDAQPQRYVRPAPSLGPAVTDSDNQGGRGGNPSYHSAPSAPSDRYGRLRLRIEPEDASVYLDGRFVGTGADLAGGDAGLVLAPGHHKLSVVRPGHKAEERDFDASMGKDVDLQVTLTPSAQ